MNVLRKLGAGIGASIMTFGLAGMALAASGSIGASGAAPLAVRQSCGIEPLDVELIIDASGSMGSNSSNGKTRLAWAQISAKQLVDDLDGSGLVVGGTGHHVGVTKFSGTTASVVQSLTAGSDDADAVKGAIDSLTSNGNTPLDKGMATGAGDLTANGRAGVKHVVILLSDGRPWVDQGPNGTWASSSSGPRPTAAEGAAYLGSADLAISVALGQGGTNGTANEVDLALMALLGPNGAYHVVNGGELPNVFADIYDQITCPAHVVAAKAVDKDAADPGDVLSYTISLSNDGGSDAIGVEVHDDISALLAHGTFDSCDNGCTHDADSVDWSGLTVPMGGSLSLHFSVDLSSTGWDAGDTHLPNRVVVASTNCNIDSQDADCAVDTVVTYTPPTEPPVTEPPVTEPPVTEPPVTEPPVTEPPVTQPPVTEPPVTEPPVTEPPAPSFSQSDEPATDIPTQPNTASIGSSGPAGPADSGWPLVFGLGVVLGIVILLSPLPARRKR